jgi:acyl phosphate:glycerol-3-phosphate acyltransferase
LLACATWAAVAALSRISSLSALVAAVLSPVWAYLLGVPQMALLCVLLAVLILWRHRENIARLTAGTEPRIGRKT